MEAKTQNIDVFVVVGLWNMAIFSEEWVKSNILDENDEYTIQYPLGVIGSLKFVLKNVAFFINGNRLAFQVRVADDVAYREIVKYARRVCQKLIHTPVESFGVNFVYSGTQELTIDGDLKSNCEAVKAVGSEVIVTDITRSFKRSDRETLNLKTRYNGDEEILDFNFSFNVRSLNDILDLIEDDDDLIVMKHQEAKQIMEGLTK